MPGCRHRAFKDVHHLDLRSEGGTHDPERLVLLCTQHHQRAHEGSLLIEGVFSTGFVFRHPDGSAYGSPGLDASKAALMKQVFGALVALEFPQREARAMCDLAKLEIAVDDDIGEAVKKALRYANVPGTKSYAPADERPDRVAEPLVPYRRLLPSPALRHGGGCPEPAVAPT